MVDYVKVPVKEVRGEKWGALAFLGLNHEICGESVRCIEARYSFAGEHRVALYRFKKNVYWRIPTGVELDISGVQPSTPPRRRPHR